MTQTTISRSGSTEAEINLLEKTYPTLETGRKITYAELESLMTFQRHSSRWIAVMTRWRRMLESRGIILKTIRDEGYQVADNRQKLDCSTKSLKQGYRRIYKASAIASVTGDEGLSQDQIRTRDHHKSIGAQLQAALMVAPKPLS